MRLCTVCFLLMGSCKPYFNLINSIISLSNGKMQVSSQQVVVRLEHYTLYYYYKTSLYSTAFYCFVLGGQWVNICSYRRCDIFLMVRDRGRMDFLLTQGIVDEVVHMSWSIN